MATQRRTNKLTDRFYILAKAISEDRRLSWAARGMLVFLLGKPDGWDLNARALAAQTADSDRPSSYEVVLLLLRELIDKGYVTRKRLPTGKVEYTVHEEPITPDDLGDIEDDEAQSGKARSGLPQSGKSPRLSSTEKAARTEKTSDAFPRPKSPESADLPAGVDREKWAAYCRMRREIRHPMTPTIAARALEDLRVRVGAGEDVNEALDYAIRAGTRAIPRPPSAGRKLSKARTAEFVGE